ncbi:MAG: hypothetical protein ACTSVI_17570 [Promethearchaeota archaeon]
MNLPLSIILSLLVALMNTVGYYLQKLGQNEIKDGLPFIKYLLTAIKKPKWLTGFIIAIGSMPVYIYALSIGHISITQPLANTGIIILVLVGIKYLKETFSKIEVVGVLSLLLGIITVSVSLPAPKENYTIIQAELIFFIMIIGIIMAGCVFLVMFKSKAIGFALISGISMGLAATFIKIIAIQITSLGYHEFSLLNISLVINLLTGIFGGQFFMPSIFLYGVIALIFVQMLTLVLAFKSGKLTFVIPVEMGTSFILPVIAGFLLFHEPASLMLVVGLTCAAIGSLLLTKTQSKVEAYLKTMKVAEIE